MTGWCRDDGRVFNQRFPGAPTGYIDGISSTLMDADRPAEPLQYYPVGVLTRQFVTKKANIPKPGL